MLPREEWLAFYDQEQRIDVTYPQIEREVLPQIVRHTGHNDRYSVILYSRLTADTADAVIAEQIAYYKALGHALEWKLFDHDQPSDLRERLATHGFCIGEEEAVLALDLNEMPPFLASPIAADIRELDDEATIREAMTILETVWGEPHEELIDELIHTRRDFPQELGLYAAYEDNQPVSVAWIRYPPNNRWASLWGGSTLAPYRRRGHYRALVAARAQAAVVRGRRFLTIDASPMSRPILEHLGFYWLATTYECSWQEK